MSLCPPPASLGALGELTSAHTAATSLSSSSLALKARGRTEAECAAKASGMARSSACSSRPPTYLGEGRGAVQDQ